MADLMKMIHYLLFTTKARIANYCSMVFHGIYKELLLEWLTETDRVKDGFFLFNMPLRDVCFYFSGDIKPQKIRILIA